MYGYADWKLVWDSQSNNLLDGEYNNAHTILKRYRKIRHNTAAVAQPHFPPAFCCKSCFPSKLCLSISAPKSGKKLDAYAMSMAYLRLHTPLTSLKHENLLHRGSLHQHNQDVLTLQAMQHFFELYKNTCLPVYGFHVLSMA